MGIQRKYYHGCVFLSYSSLYIPKLDTLQLEPEGIFRKMFNAKTLNNPQISSLCSLMQPNNYFDCQFTERDPHSEVPCSLLPLSQLCLLAYAIILQFTWNNTYVCWALGCFLAGLKKIIQHFLYLGGRAQTGVYLPAVIFVAIWHL